MRYSKGARRPSNSPRMVSGVFFVWSTCNVWGIHGLGLLKPNTFARAKAGSRGTGGFFQQRGEGIARLGSPAIFLLKGWF